MKYLIARHDQYFNRLEVSRIKLLERKSAKRYFCVAPNFRSSSARNKLGPTVSLLSWHDSKNPRLIHAA